MIRSARKAFCESPHKDKHKALVITESFQAACDYALLAMIEEVGPAVDPSRGWDGFSQITGARRVLDILKTLSDSTEPPKPPKPDSLNYRV